MAGTATNMATEANRAKADFIIFQDSNVTDAPPTSELREVSNGTLFR
jgi:hypothetical protein